MPRDRLGQNLSILKSLSLGVPVTTILLFFFRVVRDMLKKEQIRLGRMLIISAFTSVKVVEQLCKKDNSYGADEMLSTLGRGALGQNLEAQSEPFVYKKHLNCYRKLSLLFVKLLPVKSATLTKNFCKNKKNSCRCRK